MTDSFAGDLARLSASAVNPVLVVLCGSAPFVDTRGRGEKTPVAPSRKAYSAWGTECIVCIGIAVALAECGKRCMVWPEHPTFPSGHDTFASAAVTTLVLRDKRWAIVGVPLVALMSWSLVRAGYHDVPDIAGALFLGPVVTLLLHRPISHFRSR